VAAGLSAVLKRGLNSVIKDKVDMTKGILRSKALAHAVQSQDEVVLTAVHDAARFMGMGLATVINFYNPRRIILGGGLIEAVEMYYHVAVKEARRRALKIPSAKIEFAKAALGDFAGIVGAAMLMRDNGARG
jgi:glucokinase